jgi:HAE1 family hydrophobic/amphiphilic exporter-1
MYQAGIVRLRPILMTALCTIAGIMPIAIGFGAGAESRRPMGVAVVGGMVTSTFLTLLIIPVVYTLFSDLVEFFKKPVAARKSAAPEASGTLGPQV